MFKPTNEQGAIAVFFASAEQAGWTTVEIGTAFPDAILEKDGETWRTEFEYKARNFVLHNHDARECDLIICWENDFPESAIPIIELSNPEWVNVSLEKGNALLQKIAYWKQRALKSEKNLARTQLTMRNAKLHASNPKREFTIFDRQKEVLKILLKTESAELFNAAEVGRELGKTAQTIRNDKKSLIKQGYWQNGDVWAITDEGKEFLETS